MRTVLIQLPRLVLLALSAATIMVSPLCAQQSYVEGVTEILGSTDGSEIDTYSMTFETPDIAEYYGAYVQGELYQNGSLYAETSSLEYPYYNEAEAGMSLPITIGAQYQMQSDHFLVAAYYVWQDGGYEYENPEEFLISSGGSDYPSGYDFAPGGGPAYYEIQYFYLGTTVVQMSSSPPHISSINPNAGSLESSGTIRIYGTNLIDPFTQLASPAITGSGVTVTVTNASPGEVDLHFSIAENATTGVHNIALSNRFGVSNQASFNVGDPTPNITSVNPDIWNAGTTIYPVNIYGTGFGTSPTLTISGQGVTLNSYTGGDTQITASVTVASNAPAGNANITVTSNGYFGSGWVSTQQGQSNNNTGTAQVNPAPALPPTLLVNGVQIEDGQTTQVVAGQLITLTAEIPANQGTIYSETWLGPDPSGSTGGYYASTSVGKLLAIQRACDVNSLTCNLSYYYVVGHGSSGPDSVVFQYALANGTGGGPGSSASATAKFTVQVPTAVSVQVLTGAPLVVPILGTRVNQAGVQTMLPFGVSVTPYGGQGWAGILFNASATPPTGNTGVFQWVQLVDSDSGYLQSGPSRAPCTGGPVSPELDTMYPYNNVMTSGTGIGSNIATDAPGLPLAQATYVEGARQFAATMYLLWVPTPLAGCQGSSCTIPVLLGYLSIGPQTQGWQSTGDTINTLVNIATNYNNTTTTWTMGYAPQLVAPTYNDSTQAPLSNYPEWQATYLGVLTCSQ